jgi:hypothetical protein
MEGELSPCFSAFPHPEQRINTILAHIICTVRAQRGNLQEESRSFMFLILAVVLVLLWLGGFFVLHVTGFLIHLLLIFALISIIMNFVGGRRAV